MRDAGHEVTVICPQMRGYTQAEEVLEGIQIYRHWISDEARGIRGFILEYATALWGELCCALKAWRRGGFFFAVLPRRLRFVPLFMFFCNRWLSSAE